MAQCIDGEDGVVSVPYWTTYNEDIERWVDSNYGAKIVRGNPVLYQDPRTYFVAATTTCTYVMVDGAWELESTVSTPLTAKVAQPRTVTWEPFVNNPCALPTKGT